MIQNVLRETGGISLYGVASVCLFVLVFTVALVLALSMKKKHVNTMSALPLEDSASEKENHE